MSDSTVTDAARMAAEEIYDRIFEECGDADSGFPIYDRIPDDEIAKHREEDRNELRRINDVNTINRNAVIFLLNAVGTVIPSLTGQTALDLMVAYEKTQNYLFGGPKPCAQEVAQ
jgi:hypothetical protein